MEIENYVDNLGLFAESDDDIKADYILPDGKSNNNTEIPNIKGRLASHLPFWKSIGASDFILQVIARDMPCLSSQNLNQLCSATIGLQGQQGIRNL